MRYRSLTTEKSSSESAVARCTVHGTTTWVPRAGTDSPRARCSRRLTAQLVRALTELKKARDACQKAEAEAAALRLQQNAKPRDSTSPPANAALKKQLATLTQQAEASKSKDEQAQVRPLQGYARMALCNHSTGLLSAPDSSQLPQRACDLAARSV